MSQLFKCCIIAAISIFIACNQSNSNSLEHQNAVAWNQSIEEIYDDLKDRVEELEKENETFAEAVWNTDTPDTEILRRVKRHQTLIAEYKGILKKHEEIIDQNRAYIEKHEHAAIGGKEIQAQHEQIYKNLLIVQEDATQISQQIDTVLALYTALEKTLDS